MEARIYRIREKRKPRALTVVSPSDFDLVCEGAAEAAGILARPEITLYCLDDDAGEALFVETLPDARLDSHSFYYQAQYTHAVRVLTVSYGVLHRLARRITGRQFRPIPIFSVGRCGSTLAVRALARVGGVRAVSESDVFTQLAALRTSDGKRDAHLARLIESATVLLAKDSGRDERALALKFRSRGIEIADLFFAAFPRSRGLFMYRNAEDWARSAARAFHWSPAAEVGRVWSRTMERFLDMRDRMPAILPLRYETLTAFPEATMRAVLEHCRLPETGLEDALRAFGEDSQADTPLARNELAKRSFEMTDAQIRDIRLALAARPLVNSPGFVVPGTFTVTTP